MLTCFEKPVHVLEETEEEKLLKDLGDLTKGQGFMMSWEIAQGKLQQAEARVEQALVHAITVILTLSQSAVTRIEIVLPQAASKHGTVAQVAEREEQLAQYYRTQQVPDYMSEAYKGLKDQGVHIAHCC